MTDFFVANHGSIFLLTPVSLAAREWVAEHLPDAPGESMRFGPSYAVEARYIDEIVAGIQADGLEVS